jgi:hypothetical protein
MPNRATSANIDLNNKTYSTGRPVVSELSDSDKGALERKSLAALARRAR